MAREKFRDDQKKIHQLTGPPFFSCALSAGASATGAAGAAAVSAMLLNKNYTDQSLIE